MLADEGLMLVENVSLETRRTLGTFHLPPATLVCPVIIHKAPWNAIVAQIACHRPLAAVVFIMAGQFPRFDENSTQRTTAGTPRTFSMVFVKFFAHVLHHPASKLAENAIVRCPICCSSQSNKTSLRKGFKDSNGINVIVLQCIVSCCLVLSILD